MIRRKHSGDFFSILDQEEYVWAMRTSAYEEQTLEETSLDDTMTEGGSLLQERCDQDLVLVYKTTILSSFVPDEIILNVNDYTSKTFDACILCGDVSGFTELCEKYNQIGSGGPTRLTDMLTNFIGAMVQEIMSHGGDVIKFSGDAFLALWKCEEFSRRDYIQEAINCALVIQKGHNNFMTDVGVTLRVKLAISSGAVLFSLIGDSLLSHYIEVGQPILDTKDILEICHAGDIIVSEKTYAFVDASSYLAEKVLEGKFFRILGVGESWRQVQKYMNKRVLVHANVPEDNDSGSSSSSKGSNIIKEQSAEFSHKNFRISDNSISQMKKSQNQSMDTASNCEAYMSRLFRKEKSSFSTSGIKTTTNNMKPKSSVNKYSKTKPPPGRSQNINSAKGCTACIPEGNINMHKEIYVENAGVEIPIKSKPRSRSNAAGDREPWGRLLQTTNNENPSKFSSFDPLRTLHFLARELQFKLQTDLPEDNNLQQIIMDMQHALTRVPPEIASAIKLQHSSDAIPIRKSSSSNSVLQAKRAEEEIRKPKMNRSCQTVQKYEDAEIIQKIMEGSTKKLESSCRQMEMLCGRLKSEKEDLEEQLKTERENVKFLKKRVGDLEIQTDQLVSVTIQRLEEEKNELQLQVNKLTDVVDSQSVHTSYELKTVTQELKQVQLKAEQECTKLKHQLALANMEKEKYIAILTVRDKQISEIRSEMSQLQDVVNEQLMDIHNNALTELPSSNSLETENAWVMKEKENNESENQSNLSLATSENPMFTQKDFKSFQDLPSGEPTTLSEGQFKRSNDNNQSTLKNKQSIRNMFEELKKQAFAVTSVTSSKS